MHLFFSLASLALPPSLSLSLSRALSLCIYMAQLTEMRPLGPQNPALLAAVMRQMVLEQLAVPKPPLYTRVETIELEEPEADARLTPARWREAFPDDVDTTGWCDEDYEELTMIYSCAEDRRNGQRYVASSTGLWKVLPPRAQAREICALRERVRVLEQQLGSTAASDSVGFPQLRELSWMPVLVCGSGGERRGRGLKDGVGAEAQMHGPFGSVVDKDGNVFLIDTNNHAVSRALSLSSLPFAPALCKLAAPSARKLTAWRISYPHNHTAAFHMLNAIIPRCGRLRPTARSRRLRAERVGTGTAWGVRRSSVCRWVSVWTRRAAPSMCQIAATTAFG